MAWKALASHELANMVGAGGAHVAGGLVRRTDAVALIAAGQPLRLFGAA